MDFLRPLIRLLSLSLLATLLSAGEEPAAVHELKDGGVPPKAIKREAPEYPYNMRRAGLAGRVVVEFIIDKQGVVRNPIVIGSNNPWFERPAIEAILKWKFTPAEVGGAKVNIRANQILEFSMDDASGGGAGLWFVSRLKNPGELPPELRWDVAPQPVSTAFPVYPFTALQAGQSGWTEIKFIVGPGSKITASQLLQASNPEMGLAALAMIDTWEFTPPKKKNGTPCFAALSMKHEFKAHGSGDAPIPDEAKQILRMLEKKPEGIANLSELDRTPKPLSRRPPIYPTKLRQAGQAGQVMIEFFIDRNGDAQLPHIISNTEPEFGYAAAQAVATWRFEPPLKAGKPVVARVRIPLEFTQIKPAATSEEKK